ncbi:MAG: acyltransferase [Lachnospiraceae bacterium]|nr:acyltransferase [Lachnospiraceae bacterium]
MNFSGINKSESISTTSVQDTESREHGLDLLRIICMLLIISFHFSDHGYTKINYSQPMSFSYILLAISRIWGDIGNCCFILISGYFLYTKQFSIKKVFRLWFEVFIYSVFSGCLCFLLGIEEPTFFNVTSMLTPFITKQYWYFSTYIIIYILFPFLNRVINSVSRNQHKYLIFICFVLFSFLPYIGTDWLNSPSKISIFITLYFCGAYIRKYNISLSLKKSVIIFIGLILLEILSILRMKTLDPFSSPVLLFYHVTEITKPLPIFSAIAMFLIFKQLKPRSNKLISFLSRSVFGIYLFHIGRLNVLFFSIIFCNRYTYETPWLLPQMLLAVFSIFIAGILIDNIRIYIIERPVMKLMDKFLKKINNRLSEYY